MLIIKIQTRAHQEFYDLTAKISQILIEQREEALKVSAILLFSPHTTCGLTINEGADPDVASDMLNFMSQAVPWQGLGQNFKHAEGNSAAHIRTSLFGSHLVIPVDQGKIQLGRWQSIYLCEADGPRQRQIYLQWLH